MAKPILLILLLYCTALQAQDGYMVLKKKQIPIQHFWKNSRIAIQTRDGEWIRGIITKITEDSFYLTKEVIRYYLMGSDTLHFAGFRFSVKDVRAMPAKKELFYYKNDRLYIIHGHEKFVRVRNGFIFQAGGAAYAGLNIINDLANNDPPFAKKSRKKLGIGAGLFLIGTLLHLRFDPYIHLGKKYELECVILSSPNQLKSF